jgi:predicted ATP-grasp superfamily ATP-dependent carboligase
MAWPAVHGNAAGTRATLVVAGLSARALAESAACAGWRVIALDLFGDRDTRHASERWLQIGDPATLVIDAARLRRALAAAAQEPGVIGWVAGGGFEHDPALLDAGGKDVPLLGMGRGPVAALRDARCFFATLGRLGLAHPPVRFEPPGEAAGWLAKRAGGCGGWHIRAADRAHERHADTYYQRAQAGTPMSALILADGRRSTVVALNRLLVQRHGMHPHVYCGAIGPVADAALQAQVEEALARLVPVFELRGLASLDFVADGNAPWLLEINPRPSASMVLHTQAWPDGLLHAHVNAVRGKLPSSRPMHGDKVRGSRIVYADRACRIDSALADWLARWGHAHDVPAAEARLQPGEPVCSVSAEGADPRSVGQALEARCAQVLDRLVQPEEVSS